jgi:hypothetical protein
LQAGFALRGPLGRGHSLRLRRAPHAADRARGHCVLSIGLGVGNRGLDFGGFLAGCRLRGFGGDSGRGLRDLRRLGYLSSHCLRFLWRGGLSLREAVSNSQQYADYYQQNGPSGR